MANNEIITVKNPLTAKVSCHVNKTCYDKIATNISSTWPKWKKELCNKELIISVNSRKIP